MDVTGRDWNLRLKNKSCVYRTSAASLKYKYISTINNMDSIHLSRDLFVNILIRNCL